MGHDEPLYHVTKIDTNGSIHGHNEHHCNAAGCAGEELYLGTSFEEVRVGDLVRLVGDWQVEVAQEVEP